MITTMGGRMEGGGIRSRHTITTNTNLRNVFNFATDAVIVNSNFNVSLNIN
jgi:hypothetical protein